MASHRKWKPACYCMEPVCLVPFFCIWSQKSRNVENNKEIPRPEWALIKICSPTCVLIRVHWPKWARRVDSSPKTQEEKEDDKVELAKTKKQRLQTEHRRGARRPGRRTVPPAPTICSFSTSCFNLHRIAHHRNLLGQNLQYWF